MPIEVQLDRGGVATPERIHLHLGTVIIGVPLLAQTPLHALRHPFAHGLRHALTHRGCQCGGDGSDDEIVALFFFPTRSATCFRRAESASAAVLGSPGVAGSPNAVRNAVTASPNANASLSVLRSSASRVPSTPFFALLRMPSRVSGLAFLYASTPMAAVSACAINTRPALEFTKSTTGPLRTAL